MFNGQQYLDAAVDSVLSQTYPDFELLIADNCSTDASLAMARAWQESDRRVKVIESPRNLGAAPNFNRVVTAARGELFKWMACDDLIVPDFLSKCVQRMEQDPAAVLVYSDAVKIDEEGNQTRPIYDTGMELMTNSPDPVIRFRDLVLKDHSCISVFGLFRKDALCKTDLIGSYFASDRVLLADLALLGPFSRIDEPLILHREHLGRSTRSIPRARDRVAWFDTSLSEARVFPHWRLLKEYGSAVARSEMSWRQRAHCFVHLLRWIAQRNGRDLLHDLR